MRLVPESGPFSRFPLQPKTLYDDGGRNVARNNKGFE
jgi:hypothetical protein